MNEVHSRESEAEQARRKLEKDLTKLRSPEVFASFKRTLSNETIRVKDELVANVTSKASSALESFVDDLKGKATANPGAALAIGAGLAWHFARKPPITTALVGLGLYSLLRTRPHPYAGFAQARENLKNQAGEFAATAGDAAIKAKDAIVAKAVEVAEVGTEKLNTLTETASDQAQAVSSQAMRALHDVNDRLSQEGKRFSAATQKTAEDLGSTVKTIASDNRDALLLGIAGIAVSAAIGISLQRRLTQA